MKRNQTHELCIFLLGGHDLEMLEIRKILDDRKLKCIDNKLVCGAKLSSYTKDFDDKLTFAGIELRMDYEHIVRIY